MTDPRAEILSRFDSSQAGFLARVDALPAGQWRERPAQGGWTPLELAEHVTIVEIATGKLMAKRLFAEPAPDELIQATRGREEFLRSAMPDRGRRIEAPEFVRPVGTWPDSQALRAAFVEARAGIVRIYTDPGRDLRGHAVPHPVFGPMDAAQWGLWLSLHLERHLDQWDEIVAGLSG